MSFWTDATQKDPKRAFRFLVTVGAPEFGGTMFYAKKVSRPKFTTTEVKHAYLNYEFYFPGRVQWDTVTITVVDPTEPDIAQAIEELKLKSGYQIPVNPNSRVTIGKNRAHAALNTVLIELIDSDGNAVEEWELHNAWLKDPTFSELSYEDDNLTTVDLVIRYDWADLLPTSRNSPLLLT